METGNHFSETFQIQNRLIDVRTYKERGRDMDNGAESYRRFLDGDESAFAEILEQYGASLILFINGYVKNVTVAEDLMEDTFCELIFHKNRYRGKSSFKTYIFSIARNKAVTYLKKNSRRADLPVENYEKELSDIDSLERDVLKSDEKRAVYEALNKINHDYGIVLHLLYFENMAYEEIAEVLRKNNKQIKNLAYRGRKALKAELEKGGFTYENY